MKIEELEKIIDSAKKQSASHVYLYFGHTEDGIALVSDIIKSHLVFRKEYLPRELESNVYDSAKENSKEIKEEENENDGFVEYMQK